MLKPTTSNEVPKTCANCLFATRQTDKQAIESIRVFEPSGVVDPEFATLVVAQHSVTKYHFGCSRGNFGLSVPCPTGEFVSRPSQS